MAQALLYHHCMPSFAALLEMTLEELSALLDSLPPEASSLEQFYARGLQHFLRGEMAELSSLVESHQFDDHPEWPQAQEALRLRLAIRRREVAKLPSSPDDFSGAGRWQGELTLLVATAFTVRGEHKNAQHWFRVSAAALEKMGAVRKSLRARLNALVASSHLHPEKNLVADYYELHKRALAAPELSVATTCLLNISRSYQLMGSLMAALKYCTDALHLCEKNFGSQAYYLGLAQRAHLYCQLGRWAEAKLDLELASLTPFPEVKGALQVVEALLAGSEKVEAPENLLPTWKERLGSLQSLKLSPSEDTLVRFLGEKPRARVDIMDYLYGPNLDYDTKLNRLKNLLGMVRKKAPSLILCEEGYYRLSSTIHVPGRGAKKA